MALRASPSVAVGHSAGLLLAVWPPATNVNLNIRGLHFSLYQPPVRNDGHPQITARSVVAARASGEHRRLTLAVLQAERFAARRTERDQPTLVPVGQSL